MYHQQRTARSFWNTKLGHAAIASIAAMSAMIVLTTQFEASAAIDTGKAPTLLQPQADTAALIEIA
ncbi:MAG: hypothetical protein AAF707_01455 [Pseudomonadota bacterium]